MFAFPEPVTVQSAGTVTDPYSGESSADWSTPTSRAESCAVAPGGSTEPNETARNAIDSDFDLIFDHDPGISPSDRVIVDGLTCEVDGRTFRWRNPFTGDVLGYVTRVRVREG